MLLGILGWVAVGLVVGFIASKVVNLRGDDPKLGVGAAAGGAVVGGMLYCIVNWVGVTAWDPWSVLFAAVGAVVGAVTWHALRSRTISHSRQTQRSSY